jgi:hypothetical protein
MSSIVCPVCRLKLPARSVRCDCGYDFASASVEAAQEQAAGDAGRSAGRIGIAAASLGIGLAMFVYGLSLFGPFGIHPPETFPLVVVGFFALCAGIGLLVPAIRRYLNASRRARAASKLQR